MTDAGQTNKDKAEGYLERFRGETLGHLIGGEPVPGDGSKAMANHTPIDGSLLNHVALGGQAEVDHAVCAAGDAYPDWRAVSGAARRQLLHRIADAIAAREGGSVTDVALRCAQQEAIVGRILFEEGVEGRPHGAAGAEHIVHEHDDFFAEISRQFRGQQFAHATLRKVITMQPRLQRANSHFAAVQFTECRAKLFRQRHTAALDTHEHHFAIVCIRLDDFVSDPAPRAGDGFRL